MNPLSSIDLLYLISNANIYDRTVGCSEKLDCDKPETFCEICDKSIQKLYHADFTHKKQKELLNYLLNLSTLITTYSKPEQKLSCNNLEFVSEDFEVLISNFTYMVWPLLSDNQKEKVRDILNKEDY